MSDMYLETKPELLEAARAMKERGKTYAQILHMLTQVATMRKRIYRLAYLRNNKANKTSATAQLKLRNKHFTRVSISIYKHFAPELPSWLGHRPIPPAHLHKVATWVRLVENGVLVPAHLMAHFGTAFNLSFLDVHVIGGWWHDGSGELSDEVLNHRLENALFENGYYQAQ